MAKPNESYGKRLVVVVRILLWVIIVICGLKLFFQPVVDYLSCTDMQQVDRMAGNAWMLIFKLAGVFLLICWVLSLLRGWPMRKAGIAKKPVGTIVLIVLAVILAIIAYNI
jgi:hypothetical protein